MHVLLGIVGVIAALSYYFFIAKRGANAASEVIDAAETLRGKMRRNAFKKKVVGSVLTSIEDAGTAAAVLLVKTTECKNPLSSDNKIQILKILKNEIGMNDADEVLNFAEWVSGQIVNPSDIIRTFKPVWLSELNHEQVFEFIDMVGRVADVEGAPNGEQKEILRLMGERLTS